MRLLLTEISVQFTNMNVPRSALVSEIHEWIRINSDSVLSAGDVSRKFGYNADYLTRLVKSSGVPGLKQLIIKSRCDHIKYLLLSSSKPLKVIADKMGFQDENTFV